MLSKLDRSLLSKYLKPQWPRAVLLGVLLVVGIGTQLANPQVAKAFIDQARTGAPFDQLFRIGLLFLGVALLTQVSTVLETFVAEDLGWRTTNVLRADLTRHVLDLDGSFHSEHGAGELIERIDGDVSAIANFFSRFVVHVLGNAVFLAGMLVLLLVEDVRIGAVMTVFVLGALVYGTRGGGFVGRRARETRRSAAALSGFLEERLGGLVDLKSNGADDYVMRGLLERLGDRYRRVAASVTAASLYNTTIGLFFIAGTGTALALSAVLYARDAITLGSVYLVFRYATMMQLPLDRLQRQMNSLQQATGGLTRVRDLLATRPRVLDGPGASLSNDALSVELDRVSFAYSDEPVLRDVSFRIEPGEVLGLLGRTGSGKTTISRLLFRLHDPVTGIVRIDGSDIRDAELDVLRSRIALVTQDVQLFQGTVRDNVAVFDDAVPDERLCAVFAELGLDEWLRGLAAGLDTELGHHGRGLSAGEAQLVALARVFLKDPGLVVLDEASSRLDPATERLLEHAISRLLADRTGVVIAHRLTTVERADRILILEDGQIAELGSRAALLADPDSRFSRLLRAGMAEALA